MDVVSGIYEIINAVNGNRYVGSSKDIYGRWVQHQRKLNKGEHHCAYLQNAWKLYGSTSFEFRIIEKTRNTADVLFDREQYWCDYYLAQGVHLYNVSAIVVSPSHTVTVEDLQQGRYRTSYEQFIRICDLLQHTDTPLCEIAADIGCSTSHISAIYNKYSFSDLTKDMHFRDRSCKGENSSTAKLTEYEVREIADKMTTPFYTTEIAKEYGVATSTIDDIRHKRTWREITEEMVFAQPIVPVNGKKSVVQYDMGGALIKEYESGHEASRVTGIGYKMILRVCNGQRPHTHGFIFKFKTIQND
jgi:group I intron endonuclease